MAFRNANLVIIVTIVVLSIFWIAVIPIYVHGIGGFGFFFPFFFFPFIGRRRNSPRKSPSVKPSGDSDSRNQDEFDYLNIMGNENLRKPYPVRNYFFYAVAAVIFAVGIFIAFTMIL